MEIDKLRSYGPECFDYYDIGVKIWICPVPSCEIGVLQRLVVLPTLHQLGREIVMRRRVRRIECDGRLVMTDNRTRCPRPVRGCELLDFAC
jgi:hypothetical protein